MNGWNWELELMIDVKRLYDSPLPSHVDERKYLFPFDWSYNRNSRFYLILEIGEETEWSLVG
jgi:hypothetical protein